MKIIYLFLVIFLLLSCGKDEILKEEVENDTSSGFINQVNNKDNTDFITIENTNIVENIDTKEKEYQLSVKKGIDAQEKEYKLKLERDIAKQEKEYQLKIEKGIAEQEKEYQLNLKIGTTSIKKIEE